MAKRLVALFPAHTTYVELFAGGAQVLFHKPPSKVEVVNDLDEEIANFFRVCQSHHEELARCLRFMVASRRLYDLFKRQDADVLTDVQRAARWLYLLKNSFGGKPTGGNYHYCVTKPPNYNLARLPKLLAAAAARLERVQVEQRPYEKILERFDRPSTFFFCDPPYIGVKWYRKNLQEDDFRELATRLKRLQGRFLLTINDCPLSREVFGGFHLLDIGITYTATRAVREFTELLVSNYELPDRTA
jgi:DNA adenine methylase